PFPAACVLTRSAASAGRRAALGPACLGRMMIGRCRRLARRVQGESARPWNFLLSAVPTGTHTLARARVGAASSPDSARGLRARDHEHEAAVGDVAAVELDGLGIGEQA